MLVDAITEHEPGRRLVAVKNVTVNEEFFQGHFPGAPTLPGVRMLESLSQVAAILLLQREDAAPDMRVYLRGVNDAKFRRQVVPGAGCGSRWLGEAAGLARPAAAYVGDQIVAEAELLLGLIPMHRSTYGDRPPGAQVGGHVIDHATIGRTWIGPTAGRRVSVVDGWTGSVRARRSFR